MQTLKPPPFLGHPLTCIDTHSKSTQESFVVIHKLNEAVDGLIASNRDLVRRLESTEWASGGQPGSNNVPTLVSYGSRPASSAEMHWTRSTLEAALSQTRAYKRSKWRSDKDSILSLDSSRTRASFFSELTLSQASNLSLYALPIFPHELTNAEWYIEKPSQSPREEAALTNVVCPLHGVIINSVGSAEYRLSRHMILGARLILIAIRIMENWQMCRTRPRQFETQMIPQS